MLNPRSVEVARGVVWPLLGLRRHDEALAAAERALALAPSNLMLIKLKVLVYLVQGDLAGARAVLQAAGRELNPAALVAYMATYDLYWVLGGNRAQAAAKLGIGAATLYRKLKQFGAGS